jgi:hypothetical protein
MTDSAVKVSAMAANASASEILEKQFPPFLQSMPALAACVPRIRARSG